MNINRTHFRYALFLLSVLLLLSDLTKLFGSGSESALIRVLLHLVFLGFLIIDHAEIKLIITLWVAIVFITLPIVDAGIQLLYYLSDNLNAFDTRKTTKSILLIIGGLIILWINSSSSSVKDD